jgi:GNAT superfamily N-acetyltransferase
MHEPAIAIVPARRDQLPEVQRLAGVIWRAHYASIISAEQIEYMLDRGYALGVLETFVGRPGRGLELATAGEAVTGFAAWYLTDAPAQAKLDKLYVLQSRQRHGTGGHLVARVVENARAAGATTLILNVNKRNTQAIGFYEKHGFIVREAVVDDIGGGHVMDDYVMARSLAER